MQPPIVCLLGPTASGKSDLGLTLAQQFNGEIIAVDSATIYRHMDIGTAKPSQSVQQQIPHHLIDIIDPDQRYSAHQFAEDAGRIIKEVAGRGKTPLLVGGTMLYYKALMQGLNELPPANPQLRQQIDQEALRHGWAAMHARLEEVDPPTASRLKKHDAQRIQRALEVYLSTGQPLSTFHQQDTEGGWSGPVLTLALIPHDRSLLHRRIEERFKLMLKAGLADELRSLRTRFQLEASYPAMRCVGYRQMWQYLEGEIDETELTQTGIYATRQLAKRQLTWLRSLPHIEAFDPFQGSPLNAMTARVEAFLDQSVSFGA